MATTVLEEDFESFTDWTLNQGTRVVRSGRTGLGVGLTALNTIMSYTIPAPSRSDTVTAGAAWKTTTLVGGQCMHNFRSDSFATSHVCVTASAAGALEVRRGASNGTILATTAAGVVAINTWYYIELQAKIHDTTGFVTLRLNGVQVAAATNVDTKNAGTMTVIDTFSLITLAATSTYDDCYIITGSDGTFQGSQRYGTAAIDVIHEPFNNLTAWSPITVDIVTGRTGTAAMMDNVSDSLQLGIPAPSRSRYMVVGFAVLVTGTISSSAALLEFTGAVSALTSLDCDASGRLLIDNTFAVTPVATIVPGAWAYVEVKIISHTSAGAATIRVNNIVVGTAENQNIGSTSTAIERIFLNKLPGTSDVRFDDLYVLTGTLADFEGDQHIGGATVNVYNGSAFVTAPVHVYNGSAFVTAPAVKIWNGSAFV